MKSLWNQQEAARYAGDLALRVYTSRLLGQDPSLVLHGGGNTSVKIQETNLLGQEEEILYVKGSGWDLATIEEAGFAPVRMAPLLALAKLPSLSDPEMVNQLKTQMTRASAPSPSVETILHATLPYKYVDHTHADAVVTVTNTPKGRERIEEIYGDSVVVIPYVMPGFDLARFCAERFAAEAGENTLGMVLMNHGIFSFGATAQESYERMIELVSRVEEYLQAKGTWEIKREVSLPQNRRESQRVALAALRRQVSTAAGFPVIMTQHCNSKTLSFARREDVEIISQQGPATPDHVIRTKRLPLLGQEVEGYVEAYKTYFNSHVPRAGETKTMLDPAPRVILDPELGMCVVGKNAKAAAIVADIYHHTMDIILRATALESYQALSGQDIFEMEYWDLEQAKLRRGGKPPIFTGEVAVVTGAASGIGKACVDSFLQRGAAVIGLDINPAIKTLYKGPDFSGMVCDITNEKAVERALEGGVAAFGGIDMVVLNAGMFPPGCKIEALTMAEWREVMQLNLDANLTLLRECHPLLKLAPGGGRVVAIASKNVPAPGPGAASYSVSKAALNQLVRVAALEWGGDGIRINTIHPNAVFDTGIWTEEVLEARASSYGLSVEEYKKRNVLKVEVSSQDVGELAAEMCGPLFAKTTAAQVPIDGGNERVI